MLGIRDSIERCKPDDLPAAMAFFADNHSPGHILASSRRFVDWQYYVPATDDYNILIAKDDDGAILGLFAYIPNTFFDPAIPHEKKFVWTTNWLAKKDHKGFVGLALLYAMPKLEACEQLGIVGLTDEAAKFYQKTGYRVGCLAHYYAVNERVDRLKVISGTVPQRVRGARPCARLRRVASVTGLHGRVITDYFNKAEPFKSPAFFEKKYLQNPFYQYVAYAIEQNGEAAALLIGRVVSHNGANVLRLVEYAGDPAYLSAVCSQELLDAHDAEYMDIHCAGIPQQALSEAGFLRNTGTDGLIVPSYFEPFQNVNVTIAYAYRFPACCVFNGDGDRDHPRFIQ